MTAIVDLGPRYRCLRELGGGGTGKVFLVHDAHLELDVALKLLQDFGPGKIEELRREFSVLAEIEHPGIARVFDFGYLGARAFYTCRYVPGRPLGANGRSPALEQLLRGALHAAEALAFLHQNEILHLDIKPSNLIVPDAAGDPRPVLIDFGLHRRGLLELGVGGIAGSLPYMAPERFRGDQPGPWTDVYALGVTLFRWATGTYPRPAPRPSDLRRDVRREREAAFAPLPRRLGDLRRDLPRDLESILEKCLALDPLVRFGSGAEVCRALRLLLGPGLAENGNAACIPPPAMTVGRDAEISKLDRFLSGLFPDSGTAVPVLFITGPPGMGQSHLFRELKVRAQTRGRRLILETGYPARIREAGSLFRFFEAHLSGDARKRWRTFFARLAQPARVTRSETLESERRARRLSEVAAAASATGTPLVLAVDGLQHWDEVSVQLLTDLVRYLLERPAPERPPVALALGYREEGPCLPFLRELTSLLLEPGNATVLTLRPLELTETFELYRQRGGKLEAGADLGPFQATGGSPARIVALACSGPAAAKPGGPASDAAQPAVTSRARRGTEERRVLLAVELFRRPVTAPEIARVLRVGLPRLSPVLQALAGRGLVAPVEREASRAGWVSCAAAERLSGEKGEREERSLHLRVADEVLSQARSSDAGAREALDHLLAARACRRARELGLRVARFLKSTYQHRAALEVLQSLRPLLPAGNTPLRLRVALETADLHARVGDLWEGARRLKEELHFMRALPAARRLPLLLRLATLHARRGDFRMADSLFQESIERSGREWNRLDLDQQLLFLNERAAVKVFLGDHPEAARLCEVGLRRGKGSRRSSTREHVLNLLATRASIALRRFDYPTAIRDNQTALWTAEAIGSLANQAVILNNLATIHAQCERHDEAIRCYLEARTVCLSIDEGPSLASIHANLMVLFARTGRWQEMEEIWREADRLPPASHGRKQSFFLTHARGLSLVYRGRYHQARAHLEEAIRQGRELGDSYVVPMDRVYRGEALAFEGAIEEAREALAPLAAAEAPPRIRRMALARLAFVWAQGLEADRAARVDRVAAERAGIPDDHPVPFLDAWDALLLAWAFSFSGRAKQALETLEPAERFFRRSALRPAASLATLVRAECLLRSGRAREALTVLEAEPERASDAALALRPLLLAEASFEVAGEERGTARSADLLAQAGAALVGNPLLRLGARLDALRDRLGKGQTGRALPHGGDRTSGDFPTATLPLEQWTRAGLVARSPAMRKLTKTLDRLRGKEVPVLIEGETGSGKELIARLLHEESPRAARPFVVVDPSTIPVALFESELFGARAGAFTDQRRDREGILRRARGGTVLLDEVTRLPLECQAKLLSVISRGRLRPLGAEDDVPLEVRFLFATSADLAAETEAGRFRSDLFHRIRVVRLGVPPLRERGEDLPELIGSILRELSGKEGGTGAVPAVAPEVLKRLRTRTWPGNARELRNLLQRIQMSHPGPITLEALEAALGDPPTATVFPRQVLLDSPLSQLRRQLDRDYLICHFRRFEGRTSALCRFLGLSRRQLYRRCVRLGIQLREERRRLGS